MPPNNPALSRQIYMKGLRRPMATLAVVLLQTLPALLIQTAFAEDRRFHIGIGAPVDFIQASWDKTVDNTSATTLVPDPRRGQVFRDKDSSDSTGSGISLLAGYRLPLVGTGFYLNGEVDATFHQSEVDGKLQGVGTSPGRNQLGESWPDSWTLDSDRSYGITVKLGRVFSGAWSSLNASFYGLGGLRWTEAQFTNTYYGCLSGDPCSSAADTPNFSTGSEIRDLSLMGWTAGLGVEKMLGKRLGLQIEARLTQYGSESWVTSFTDLGVTVPSVVDSDNFHLLFRLAWYP